VNPCSNDEQFANDIATSIAALSSKYADLDKAINCIRPDDDAPDNCLDPEKQIPRLVLITEYFDPTHDKDGNFPGPVVSNACTGLLVGPAEWEFLYNNVVVPLNQQVRASPWNAVVGIHDAFLRHGYCAFGERWVVRIDDSFAFQFDQNGTGHPNLTGQAVYRDHIFADLIALNPPVTTASATAGGTRYMFGTWTGEDVEVTLSAENPISESGVGNTYYAVDNPSCQPENPGNCLIFGGPFTITTSGQHIVTFFSDNAFRGREALQTVEVWIDKDPPVMTCSATPSMLWPPNGRFIQVMTSVEAIDAVSGPVPFVLTSVTTSEGSVSDDTRDFIIGQPDTDGELKANRLGSGSGRVYALTYQSMDEVGNIGSCTVDVIVSHDQRSSSGQNVPASGNGGHVGNGNENGRKIR